MLQQYANQCLIPMYHYFCTTSCMYVGVHVFNRYEGSMGTARGNEQSAAYNVVIRAATLQHAILAPLKRCCEVRQKQQQSKKATTAAAAADDIFKEVMYQHFTLKKEQVNSLLLILPLQCFYSSYT
jgi:2-methylisocitrate lyase-like PEP mutase family enzyme